MTVPITEDDKRGMTSKQLRDAPPAALFFIHNMRQLGWFTGLAASLGRGDIQFRLAADLGVAERVYGMNPALVVVDHWTAANLTASQAAGLALLRERAALHESVTGRHT